MSVKHWSAATNVRTNVSLLLAIFGVACFAQQLAVPTRRILPDEVVQDSVHMMQMRTNNFVVRWTYTEEGAKKMLAFQEANEGQKVRTVIGEVQLPVGEVVGFRPMPPAFTNYAQWKEGWLKHRTDKVMGVSESDAKKIVAGLKHN